MRQQYRRTLQLQSGSVNLGTVSFRLPVGTPNGVFTQNFDSVTAPALPGDWSTTGNGVLAGWITTTSAADTGPNSAFCPDTNDVGEAQLISPSVSITSSNAQLIFRNNYDLELGYDGGVLEIKIGSGIFQDIYTAGGSFEQGGYSEVINTNAVNSSLIGLAAWSGNSGRLDYHGRGPSGRCGWPERSAALALRNGCQWWRQWLVYRQRCD